MAHIRRLYRLRNIATTLQSIGKLVLVVALTSIGPIAGSFALQSDLPLESMELDGAVRLATYDEVTGKLFVAGPFKNSIRAYDFSNLERTGVPPFKTIECSFKPRQLCFCCGSSGFIAVAVESENAIYLFDRNSLEMKAKIDLEKGAVVEGVASRGDNELLAVIRQDTDLSIYQFMLSESAEVLAKKVKKYDYGSFESMFVVNGPNILVAEHQRSHAKIIQNPMSRQPASTFSLYLPQVSRSGKFESIEVTPSPRLAFVDGSSFVVGVYAVDLENKEPKASFDIPPQAFSPNTSAYLALGLSTGVPNLICKDFVTGKVISTTEIPKECFGGMLVKNEIIEDRSLIAQSIGKISMALDGNRKIAFVFGDRIIAWKRIPELPPAAHFMKIDDLNCILGEEYTLKLPSAPDTHVELISGPSGVSIGEGLLRWKPTIDQLGSQSFRVSITDKSQIPISQAWRVQVSLPKLEIPFWANLVYLDPEQKRLLVIGSKDNEEREFQSPTVTEVAIVDLESRQVIASGKLQRRCFSACIVGNRVVLSDKTMAYLLDAKTLQLVGENKIPGDIISVWQNKYVTIGDDSIFNAPALYELPKLEKVRLNGYSKSPYPESVISTKDGLVVATVLFKGPGKPKLALPIEMSNVPVWSNIWGVLNSNAVNYSNVRDATVHLLQDFNLPVLGYTDLLQFENVSKPSRSFQLKLPSVTSRAYGSSSPPGSMAFSKSQLFVARSGEVHVVDRTELHEPESFRVEPEQSKFALPPTGSISVKYSSEGASRFELDFLAEPFESFTSDSGTFQISVQKMVLAHMKAIASWGDRDFLRSKPEEFSQDFDRVSFRLCTGSEAKGKLLKLPVRVTAYKDSGEFAILNHLYWVDIPKESIKKYLDNPDEFEAKLEKSKKGASSASSSPAAKDPPKSAGDSKDRLWIRKDGKKVNGEYVGTSGKSVQIKVGGKVYDVPLDSLSEEDQAWVRKQNSQ